MTECLIDAGEQNQNAALIRGELTSRFGFSSIFESQIAATLCSQLRRPWSSML